MVELTIDDKFENLMIQQEYSVFEMDTVEMLRFTTDDYKILAAIKAEGYCGNYRFIATADHDICVYYDCQLDTHSSYCGFENFFKFRIEKITTSNCFNIEKLIADDIPLSEIVNRSKYYA